MRKFLCLGSVGHDLLFEEFLPGFCPFVRIFFIIDVVESGPRGALSAAAATPRSADHAIFVTVILVRHQISHGIAPNWLPVLLVTLARVQNITVVVLW